MILILAVTTIGSYWQVYQTNEDVDQVLNIQTPMEHSVWEMENSTITASQALINYSQYVDSENLDQANTSVSHFELSLDQFIALASTDDLAYMGSQLSSFQDESVRLNNEIVALVDKQNTGLESFLEDIEKIGDSVENWLRNQIEPDDPDAAIKLETAFGMEFSVLSISTTIGKYTVHPETSLQHGIQESESDFQGYVEMYRGTVMSDLEESWLAEIGDDFDDVIDDANDLMVIADNLNTSLGEYEQNTQQIIAVLNDEVQPLLGPELAQAVDDANDSFVATKTWILVLGILGLAIGCGLAWIVSRRIVLSLRGLQKGAKAVADGKLEHRFYIDVKDEFGQIALTLNQVLENIGRSREALGESEETAWQLLDATTDSVFLMDLRGVILASNEVAAARYNKSLEQMIDTSFYDLLPADLMASRKAQIAEVVKTGIPFHFEDDREGMVLDTRIFPVISPENGRVVRISIFSRDITTRKWVEDVTESLGRRNELILEAAGEGIYGLDTQGRTTFVNPAAARMLGYKPGDLIGQFHHELVHHSKLNGMPYLSSQCPIHAAFRDGIARTNVDDEVFWRKDGTSFPIEYTAIPILENEKVVGAVVTFRDITERKHMEIALLRSEERYRSMFESPATLIISVDGEGIIVDCNPRVQRMMGYIPDEMISHDLIQFVHEDYHTLVQTSLHDVLAKGFDYNKQYKMTRKDGTEIDVNVNYASVKDENGEYVRTICMIDDVTERVKT